MLNKIGARIFRFRNKSLYHYYSYFKIKTRNGRVMIIKDGKVLLVRHLFGTVWAFPGGGVGKKESFAAGAVREVREELGVKLPEDLERLGNYQTALPKRDHEIEVFIAEVASDFEPTKQSVEIAEWGWHEIESLPAKMDGGTRQRVQEYLAGERPVGKVWYPLG